MNERARATAADREHSRWQVERCSWLLGRTRMHWMPLSNLASASASTAWSTVLGAGPASSAIAAAGGSRRAWSSGDTGTNPKAASSGGHSTTFKVHRCCDARYCFEYAKPAPSSAEIRWQTVIEEAAALRRAAPPDVSTLSNVFVRINNARGVIF